ncbi:hypothetical protein F6Q07_19790 [Pectobacterium parmentieri]|uniref:Exported protein n=1 Tax=Pectobacterium parmentieri TaxID=1905730 RepID=A0A0H3I497_PECPM|nr:hypothetical protein [Pectobacterium parmentieri]ACX86365.1 hypothetical protein Pecwa_0536 [Pectobacterium parmentieri WPP163]AFI88680.1 Putative exported protein [Pectobacterium parmentieri]AOR60326.1 hypothetical protein A8F97_15700 [Pectobacterium parmentieri]AYG99960.1 hypothetical protein C5E26_02795 [Pectobacterium parmentieri]AYH04440.1 hypothetical protein C5E25_03150 [Pectobacterium parmentieri]
MLKFKYSDFIKAIFLLFFSIGVFIVSAILFYEESYHYKKNNYFTYYILTLDEVKDIPVISDNYEFYYYSQDGTQRLTNGVVFYNPIPERKAELVEYIEMLGFKKTKNIPWSYRNISEAWIKGHDEVNLIQDDKERTIDISFIKG